jgi:two-component system, chemotaxis family, sensor kinase CheA
MDTSPTDTYLAEAQDLLDQIEATALELSAGEADSDAVNRLFRAFHTIKGSGAMFGFSAVAEFTHHVESTLDHVRTGRLAMSPDLIEIILAAKDHIRDLLADPRAAAASGKGPTVLARLGVIAGSEVETARPTAAAQAAKPSSSNSSRYTVKFRPNPKIALTGLDPLSLLRDLRQLGECEVRPLIDRLPTLDVLDPESCFLGWEIRLTTSADLNAIKDVFVFAEDGAELNIELEPATAVEAVDSTPGANAQTEVKLERSKAPAANSVVRVAATRLDRLVSLVGELVMNQSRLNRAASRIQDTDIAAPVEAFERLIAELRDSVLGIRMTPIGGTFGRFRRLVHDLSRELGKEIDLVTSGEDTELDKTVLDQLGDPLVHLIRNSLDHGIEKQELRLERGKPARGTLKLGAAQVGTEIIVTIEDDGAGLNTEAIRRRAIHRGLITESAVLSERELHNMIFMPGFSTAEKVTNVSGRGVGMDVVRRQIETLRGSVRLSSVAGQGTTVTLALPMTLAIIDGLLVQVGADPFIIPMASVLENVELPTRSRGSQRDAVSVRGDLVPYIRLRDVFTMSGQAPEFEKIVVVRHGGQRVGLVVDRVIGSHQTVIQSLNRFCRGIEVISGTTIMGDGRVALILDIAGVLRAEQANAAHEAA